MNVGMGWTVVSVIDPIWVLVALKAHGPGALRVTVRDQLHPADDVVTVDATVTVSG